VLQTSSEEEAVFNEAVYGKPLQLQHHLVQPQLPPAQPAERADVAVAPRHAAHLASSALPMLAGQEVPQVRSRTMRECGWLCSPG